MLRETGQEPGRKCRLASFKGVKHTRDSSRNRIEHITVSSKQAMRSTKTATRNHGNGVGANHQHGPGVCVFDKKLDRIPRNTGKHLSGESHSFDQKDANQFLDPSASAVERVLPTVLGTHQG